MTLSRRAAVTLAVAGSVALLVVPGSRLLHADAVPGSCSWQRLATTAGQAAWMIDLPARSHSSLLLRGQYPRAAYMSVTTYDEKMRSVDSLNDVRMSPDGGSTNPAVPGARRAVTPRSWTAAVVRGAGDGVARPNTVYTVASGRAAGRFLVIYREYLPDAGAALTGPPSVTYRIRSTSRALPPCEGRGSGGQHVSPLPSASVLARVGPGWQKFANWQTADGLVLSNPFSGAPAGEWLSDGPLGTGAVVENPDLAYLGSRVALRPGQVLIVRGTMPTVLAGARAVTPVTDLAGWWMCTQAGHAAAAYSCVDSRSVPLAAGRVYSVVVSTPSARPRSATAACGYAWLPLAPGADSLVVERNLMPDKAFSGSIQAARVGHEARDLGAFEPRTQVLAAAALPCLPR